MNTNTVTLPPIYKDAWWLARNLDDTVTEHCMHNFLKQGLSSITSYIHFGHEYC